MRVNLNIVFLLLLLSFSAPDLMASENKTIYLVRHAEKEKDQGKDPELTLLGQRRASELLNQLSDKKITTIYSTDYKRTQHTAQPLAEHLGIQVESYDPRQLSIFAEKLLQAEGNLLVVGHSNTTPQLVRLLGGQAEDIDETVYNHLYRVEFAGKQVTTQILQFEPE